MPRADVRSYASICDETHRYIFVFPVAILRCGMEYLSIAFGHEPSEITPFMRAGFCYFGNWDEAETQLLEIAKAHYEFDRTNCLTGDLVLMRLELDADPMGTNSPSTYAFIRNNEKRAVNWAQRDMGFQASDGDSIGSLLEDSKVF